MAPWARLSPALGTSNETQSGNWLIPSGIPCVESREGGLSC